MMLLITIVFGVLRLVPDVSSGIETGGMYEHSCQLSSQFNSFWTVLMMDCGDDNSCLCYCAYRYHVCIIWSFVALVFPVAGSTLTVTVMWASVLRTCLNCCRFC